jgi:type IV secretory pathway component VirB8
MPTNDEKKLYAAIIMIVSIIAVVIGICVSFLTPDPTNRGFLVVLAGISLAILADNTMAQARFDEAVAKLMALHGGKIDGTP